MTFDLRDKIRSAFTKAPDYDGNAQIQRLVAENLARRIMALPLPENPRVLEIGCGTGFLTQALLNQGLRGEWLITDIAPSMLERCKTRLAGHSPSQASHAAPALSLSFAILDGEYGTPPSPPFDLICSSLAMQWFDDTPQALLRLTRLLKPDGHLVITTLGPQSFHEWRSAHNAEDLAPGTPRFAPLSAFETLPTAQCLVEEHPETHPDPRAFLHALKAIGAHTSHPDHRPLTPMQLRKVMARFADQGCTVTYEVITCHLQALQV